MKIKNKFIGLLEYIVVICMIIDFNSIWTRNNPTLEKANYFILCITLTILVLVLVLTRRNIMSRRDKIILVIIISGLEIYNAMFIFFNRVNSKNFITVFAIIFVEFIVYTSYRTKENRSNILLIKISNIVVILSIISLIFYTFGSNMNIISPSKYVLVDWGGIRLVPSYYGLYYQTQTSLIANFKVIRNSGMFNEPAIYAACLCLALMAQLFLNDRKNKKKVVIILVTLFTTFSTTGIVIGVILITVKILHKKTYETKSSIKTKLLIPIIVLISLIAVSFFINDKVIQSRDNSSKSYSVRMDDIRVGFEAWKDHKLMGNGYNDRTAAKNYMIILDRGLDTGGSNGLMMVLSQGGIYLLAIYILCYVMVIKNFIKKKNLKNIIIYSTLLMLICGNAIQYQCITIYLIANGITVNFMHNDLEELE